LALASSAAAPPITANHLVVHEPGLSAQPVALLNKMQSVPELVTIASHYCSEFDFTHSTSSATQYRKRDEIPTEANPTVPSCKPSTPKTTNDTANLAFGVLGVASAVVTILGFTYACFRRGRTFVQSRSSRPSTDDAYELPFVSPWTGPSLWSAGLLSSPRSVRMRAFLVSLTSPRYRGGEAGRDQLYPAGPDWND
jgi:hypothetical protein